MSQMTRCRDCGGFLFVGHKCPIDEPDKVETPPPATHCKHGYAHDEMRTGAVTCTQCDAEFGKQVERMLRATQAIEAYELGNGERLNLVTTITCPCCKAQNALQFYRTANHLYLQCSTEDCVPQVRANCRGRKRRR